MNARVFVDTNVLVYVRDASKPQKQAQAVEWLSHLWKTGSGRLSMQVLSEYYSVVTLKLKPGLDKAIARDDIEDLFNWQPSPMTQELVAEGWYIQDLFHLSWWDWLIVAAARVQHCSYLVSEDFQNYQDFQGLQVINPFLVTPEML